MCLITKDPTFRVAEEDITVFKHVVFTTYKNYNRTFWDKVFGRNKTCEFACSLVQGYHYKKGELNPLVRLKPEHCDYGLTIPAYKVEDGYHSNVDNYSIHNALFVIPKGTRYIEGFYNGNGARNYVSETIIFKEKV